MLLTHGREKLINAIIFFATKTHFLGKTKICKLLYFLDFEHFKETGRSVTGMDYFAWKMGPVPVELYEEMDMPQPDMAEKIEFSAKQTKRGTMLLVKPIAKFDSTHFTKREIRILEVLAREFCDTRSEDMVERTHLENEPWHKIFVESGMRQELIPYELALRKQEKTEMQDLIAERKDFIENFRKA